MHKLTFSDAERSIAVTMETTLKDPLNLDEQFYLQAVKSVDSYLEQELFYCWNKGVPYTLNEMIFFTVNNRLTLKIFDETGLELIAQYHKNAVA